MVNHAEAVTVSRSAGVPHPGPSDQARQRPWSMPVEPRIEAEEFGGSGWREMVALRHSVLRAPLGLTFDDRHLAAEAGQIHLGLWLGTLLAGTLLALPPDQPAHPAGAEGKLRQMAILPGLQRGGLGTLLLRRGEAELHRLGATGARLAARDSATGFYARLGYRAEGALFIEVTLPHRLMRRDFGSGDPPV